jgi:hypothetical protein
VSPLTLEIDESTTAIAEPTAARWVSQQFFDPNFKDFVTSKISALRQLPPGWDGYAARQISPAIIDAAIEFVKALKDNVAPRPRIVPLTSGGLQLEWVSGERNALELEFESPEKIHYLRWQPTAHVEDENVFDVTDVRFAEGLLEWFARLDAA